MEKQRGWCRLQRREILDRLRGDERLLVATAWDKAERAARNWQTEFTGFLDPGQRALLVDYCHLWSGEMTSFGGYADAERQIVAFTAPGQAADGEPTASRWGHSSSNETGFMSGPQNEHKVEGCPPTLSFPLAAVQVSGNLQFASLAHRDYLGSLLALGLKRELFGDILVLPEGCQVVLHEQSLSFVLSNWAAVGPIGIRVEQIELGLLQPPEREMSLRTATVATARLDAIVAAAYGISRSKATDLIKAGKVKLNYRQEVKAEKQLTEGAMLSLAGSGRAELLEVGGSSKSGRVYIKVARWI